MRVKHAHLARTVQCPAGQLSGTLTNATHQMRWIRKFNLVEVMRNIWETPVYLPMASISAFTPEDRIIDQSDNFLPSAHTKKK